MVSTTVFLFWFTLIGVGFSLPTRNRQLETDIIHAQSNTDEEWPTMDTPLIRKAEIIISNIDANLERRNEVNSIFEWDLDTSYQDEKARELLYHFLSKMTP